MPLTLKNRPNSRTVTIRSEDRHRLGHPDGNGVSMGRNDSQESWSTRGVCAPNR